MLDEKIGKWFVLGEDPNDSKRMLCKCECGTERSVLKHSLKYGRSKSCGCNKRESANWIDETGNRYGRLLVLERSESKPSGAAFKCLCDCGNTTFVLGGHLRAGTTSSCGCIKEEFLDSLVNDLTGKVFGRLTVLYRENRISDQPKWVCECLCGNKTKINRRELVSGKTNSCGCIGASLNEVLISDELTKLEINFKREFTFSDLVSAKGGLLRYDFCIEGENGRLVLIEYDGIQHFDKNNAFWTETQSQNDSIKNRYANNNNIKLYRINYTQNTLIELHKILNMEGLI